MSTILGLDPGKFKSVACLDDTTTTAARFATVHTDPAELRKFLEGERPGLVVFETCTVAGWVADLRAELGLEFAVARIGPYKLLQPIGEGGMGPSTWPSRPSLSSGWWR